MRLFSLSSDEIEKALKATKPRSRHYLVGNLKTPQPIGHISSKDAEIAICEYNSGDIDEAHWHPIQNEYLYVLKGKIELTTIPENEKQVFKQGDFFSIQKNQCTQLKCLENARLFFIKVPSINDKTDCKKCEKKCEFRVNE